MQILHSMSIDYYLLFDDQLIMVFITHSTYFGKILLSNVPWNLKYRYSYKTFVIAI